ncbi:MAG: helix-turn-helix domain-containing protein [Rhodobacterales bacterium]|nr:helix-turn-helix domain-containing protein [Rhodobacterales bacterium]
MGTDEVVTVTRMPQRFWIGDGSLLSEMSRMLSVAAAADCHLFRIPGKSLMRSFEAFPGDWMFLYRLAALNGALTVRTLAESLVLPPKSRFARLMLRMATPDGAVQTTQEELGRLAGMSRAAFRRAFSSLIEGGSVETGRGSITIIDREALEREAAKTWE